MTVIAWLRKHHAHRIQMRLNDGRWVCQCGKTKRDSAIDLEPVPHPPVKRLRRSSSKPRGAARRATARRARWEAHGAYWDAIEAAWAEEVAEVFEVYPQGPGVVIPQDARIS